MSVSELPRADMNKLWATLEHVPHAHVDQHSISSIAGMPLPRNVAAADAAGVFYPDSNKVTLLPSSPDIAATEYDRNQPLSEAEAIQAVGSVAELQRFVSEGRMHKDADGSYRFVQQAIAEPFSAIALHEIGHSVDAMLGGRTSFIYDVVGWRRYNPEDFERWAVSLGGWELVSDVDRKAITKVWLSWLRGGSQGAVADLVGESHPAVAQPYAEASVGVVRAARLPLATEFVPVGGLYATVKFRNQALYTLTPRGYNAAPSAYSLTSPEEYFAECYSNYYRESDGTAASAAKKGASLVPWIKTWFDSNVDRIGHNPKR